MVHVPVGQQDVVDGNELVGRLADVEADIELRHPHHRFLAGNRIAEQVEIVDLNMGQIMTGHFDSLFMVFDL